MLARLALALTLLLAAPKLDAALVGTWGLNGQPFMTLKADGTGTMAEDPIKWKSNGSKITVTGDEDSDEVPYTLKDGTLTIVSGGVPIALTKMGGSVKFDAKIAAANKEAKEKPAKTEKEKEPAKPAKTVAGKAGNDQLSKLLLSSAWCSFHYNQVSGTSSSKRFVYRADGTWQKGGRTETYSSGYGGTFAGQHDSANSGSWKVEGGQFYASSGESGGQFVLIPLTITKNSNGYPIITAYGEEFSSCQ